MNLLLLNIFKTKFLYFGSKKTILSNYNNVKVHEIFCSIRICNCKQLIHKSFEIKHQGFIINEPLKSQIRHLSTRIIIEKLCLSLKLKKNTFH